MGKDTARLRLLYLQDVFTRYSDESNVFGAEDLCEILLKKYNIQAERKTIYSDIDALREYGFDIVNVRTPVRGYYLKNRRFEMAELRLLLDAVSAARFISHEQTQALTKKICSSLSESQETLLKEQVYVNSMSKGVNDDVYETISVLNKAIQQGVQVEYNYSKRQLKERYVIRESHKSRVSPYALIWSNDNYYLVCNNPKYNNLMHVRLDRISGIEITSIPARHFSQVCDYEESFDATDYANRLFNMFSGEKSGIVLRCVNEIIDEILDRFGEKVSVRIDGEGHFVVKATVELSDGLVSWIMQYGELIQVQKPYRLKRAIIDKAKIILNSYE